MAMIELPRDFKDLLKCLNAKSVQAIIRGAAIDNRYETMDETSVPITATPLSLSKATIDVVNSDGEAAQVVRMTSSGHSTSLKRDQFQADARLGGVG